MSGQFALAVELLRFLIPPGESQAFLAAAAGEPERLSEPGSAPPADLPSQGVSNDADDARCLLHSLQISVSLVDIR